VLRVRSLGRVGYEEAWALQRALARHAVDDYLLCLEHEHVFTLGAHADPAHVLVDPAEHGVGMVRTDRGGDVTYHGPGQLVIYPIRTVPDGPGAGTRHVRELEGIVVSALEALGVAERCGGVGTLPAYPGVWLGVDTPRPRKVASIGVRTMRVGGPGRRRRTLHGAAINVDCDLEMFARIVPCGIAELPVSSLAAEGESITLAVLTDAVVDAARAAWEPSGAPERQAVRTGPAGPASGAVGESAPILRLRQAGVDPGAAVAIGERKPVWLRRPVRMGSSYRSVGQTLHALDLVTVCEEAGCPNIYECWADGTATFMVNGSRCTRACGFCKVDTRHPLALDPAEPLRVAEAVERMRLAHAVITCVARDDLPDGGAGAIAATVRAIRDRTPATRVEVLASDCKGDGPSLQLLFDASPDVFNHNLETVARLQRAVRPSAGYARSLSVLARAREAGLTTKSGIMVGLGETGDEVVAALADLRAVGVEIATIGQYLRPSAAHLPVARYWEPTEFDQLREAGLALGFSHVEASPLTRSSYHAREAAVSGAQGRERLSMAN
jgi:lipoyl synthase